MWAQRGKNKIVRNEYINDTGMKYCKIDFIKTLY